MPQYKTVKIVVSYIWNATFTDGLPVTTDAIPVSIGKKRVKFCSPYPVSDNIYKLPSVAYEYFPISKFTDAEMSEIRAACLENQVLYIKSQEAQ